MYTYLWFTVVYYTYPVFYCAECKQVPTGSALRGRKYVVW